MKLLKILLALQISSAHSIEMSLYSENKNQGIYFPKFLNGTLLNFQGGAILSSTPCNIISNTRTDDFLIFENESKVGESCNIKLSRECGFFWHTL